MEIGTKEYAQFMCNPNNICNCCECPENEDRDGKYPCGQQNCWVACHCERG